MMSFSEAVIPSLAMDLRPLRLEILQSPCKVSFNMTMGGER
jgi:hypothetical protein